jgi:hypothetical protein
MPAGGEMPQGPNMGVLTSMMQSVGGNPGAQLRLCCWLPEIDGKRLNTIAEFLQITADKMIMFNTLNIFPAQGVGLGSLGIFKELMDLLKQGGQPIDFASDLQDALDILRNAGVSGIEEGNFKSLMGNLAANNVNMQAMMTGGDGHSVG